MVGRCKKEPTGPDELGLGTDVQRLRLRPQGGSGYEVQGTRKTYSQGERKSK